MQEKEREWAVIRVKELEQIQKAKKKIKHQNTKIKKLNKNVNQLSGEVKRLNEQLTVEMENSYKITSNYINFPKKLKQIFNNDLPILTKFKNQSSDLLHEFNDDAESKFIISSYLEDFMIKGEIPIGCSDCLLWPDVLDYVTMICEVEKIVAYKIEKQVKENYQAFSEWNDDDTVKLTLIFNIFGLSYDIIQKFGPSLNGIELDKDLFSVCSTFDIDDWSILDLGYIQMMLRNNLLPCPKHFLYCPVCRCSTPNELENLLREYHLELDYNLLARKNINGPKFLAIGNTRWLKLCEEEIDETSFLNAIKQIKKLHYLDDSVK